MHEELVKRTGLLEGVQTSYLNQSLFFQVKSCVSVCSLLLMLFNSFGMFVLLLYLLGHTVKQATHRAEVSKLLLLNRFCQLNRVNFHLIWFRLGFCFLFELLLLLQIYLLNFLRLKFNQLLRNKLFFFYQSFPQASGKCHLF